jgi:hypothetical protein
MNQIATISFSGLLGAGLRIAFLFTLLLTPLLAIQSVQASSASIIESVSAPQKGIGFVLVTSLRRV